VTLMLLRREYDYLHWFWPVLVGVVGGAVVMMLWHPRVARAAIVVGLAMLLVVPAIYSATTWQVPVNGTFPTAGPYIEDDTEALGIRPTRSRSTASCSSTFAPTSRRAAGMC